MGKKYPRIRNKSERNNEKIYQVSANLKALRGGSMPYRLRICSMFGETESRLGGEILMPNTDSKIKIAGKN